MSLKKQKLKSKKPNQFVALPPHGGSTDREKPVFSLHLLQKGYCVADCKTNEKASLADCLRKLSNFCWLELKNDKRHGLGCEKIDKHCIKASIPEITPKNDTFLAFRFHGKAPMVGYREGRIFHILWLDRSFALYDHG
jgi:hypothetical protein